MAKKFIAGNSRCNKCKVDAQGSMYRTNEGARICRVCALALLKEYEYEMQ